MPASLIYEYSTKLVVEAAFAVAADPPVETANMRFFGTK